jgi:hypothetical protein
MLAVLIGGLMVSPFSSTRFSRSMRWRRRSCRRVEAPAGDHGLHGAIRIRPLGMAVVGCVWRRPVMIWGIATWAPGRILADVRAADRVPGAAGCDRRGGRGHRPRHHPRSVRRRRGPAPHESDHHDLRPGARGRTDHRRLGPRGLRLARRVRRHGGLRHRVFAGLVVEVAGDPSATGAILFNGATWSRLRRPCCGIPNS